jgi:hypothetical protein
MTIPEILKELEPYTGRFPMKAMRAAVEQREAITPELLRVLEHVAADPEQYAKQKAYMLPMFALFLLAQFREKRAYPLVIKLFSAPGETPFDLVGDTVTEGLEQIIGSVYDGDPAPLKGLVENSEANEYVRGAAINTFLVLEHSGQMSRQEVVSYFQSLFRGKLEQRPSLAWNLLACAVSDMPVPELLNDVRQAYDDGLIDPGFISLANIERDLRRPAPTCRERLHLITDAIAEMEGWAAFDESPPGQKEKPPPKPEPLLSEPVFPPPVVRRKVGRNEPCPCGSGKKYKRCCGKS